MRRERLDFGRGQMVAAASLRLLRRDERGRPPVIVPSPSLLLALIAVLLAAWAVLGLLDRGGR